jgi:hypothetical protein
MPKLVALIIKTQYNHNNCYTKLLLLDGRLQQQQNVNLTQRDGNTPYQFHRIIMLHLHAQTVPETALLDPEVEGIVSLQNRDNCLPLNQ